VAIFEARIMHLRGIGGWFGASVAITWYVTFLIVACDVANAQSQGPLGGRPGSVTEGSVGVRPAPGVAALSGAQPLRRHLDPIGRPCVAVAGNAQPEVLNPHIFEHIVTASNSCSQIVRVQVCYHGSDRCVPLVVPSYGRKLAVLGIEPALASFRFEFWEQFP
jgi:hypothetical protein